MFDIFKSKTERVLHAGEPVAHAEDLREGRTLVRHRLRRHRRRSTFPDAKRLLVLFPATHFRMEGVEPIKRHYQDELTIHQTTAHHFEQGHTEGFITVLVPHGRQGRPGRAGGARSRSSRPRRRAPASRSRSRSVGGESRWPPSRICAATSPTITGGRGTRSRRAGLATAPLETDGDFVFASRQGDDLSYTSVNMTRAQYGEQVLFQNKTSYPRAAVRRHVGSRRHRQGPVLARYGEGDARMAAETSIRTGRPGDRRAVSAGARASSSRTSSTCASTASASAAIGHLTRRRCGFATTAT